MIAGKIKEMKIRSGLTNKQVSEISGVPIATVNRVMSDQVQNPNFETISAIVTALGGSIDEVVGHTPTLLLSVEENTSASGDSDISQGNLTRNEQFPEIHSSDTIRAYELLLEERAKIIEGKNQIIIGKDQWIKRLFITCCVLVGIITAVLVFDLLNPATGFFQH